jgi:Tol biopolymer transport system component
MKTEARIFPCRKWSDISSQLGPEGIEDLAIAIRGIIYFVNKHKTSFLVPLAMLLAASYGSTKQQGSDATSSWRVKKIAVVVGSIPHTAIFVIDPPNSKPRQLAEGEAPAWSPDGERLAYCVRLGPRGFGQIQVINADGSGRKQLTNVKGGGCAPDWSPDGEKIAFMATGGKAPTISIIDKNGENVRSLAEGSEARWSPDTKRLVFARYAQQRGTMNSIWIANADGTEVKMVAEVDSEIVEPRWLPDGKSIAYSSKLGGRASVFRINLDGTGIESVAADKKYSLYFPVFSPDSKQLVVDANAGSGDGSSILQIDLITHEAKLLVRGRHPSVLWENM